LKLETVRGLSPEDSSPQPDRTAAIDSSSHTEQAPALPGPADTSPVRDVKAKAAVLTNLAGGADTPPRGRLMSASLYKVFEEAEGDQAER
jgi:hypothetical protein